MTVAFLLGALAAQGVAVEALKEEAPTALSEAVRKELRAEGLRVLRDGKPWVDLWLRASLPAAAPRTVPRVRYPELAPGSLLGAVRVPAPMPDFRTRVVPAGTYTLRYAEQPSDPDHDGMTETRDFLVLCPAEADADPSPIAHESLAKLSARIHAKKHPAVLSLVRSEGDGLVRDEKRRLWVLRVRIGDLPLGVVVAGKSPEFPKDDDDAPSFDGLRWIGDPPDLKGKVAVVRWWTSGCDLCKGSAPALTRLAGKASMVAVFHPKPPRDVADADVQAAAKAIGMPGALAVDRDWTVLDRWAAPAGRAFTSLTFLLDRKGKVRHVHPGGTVTEEEGKELERRIEALLAEEY
jgi:hypothetical protein